MSQVVTFPKPATPRWRATLTYRADAGTYEVVRHLEEIAELHGIIEDGPDWRTLESCVVTLLRNDSPGLTVEQSLEI